MKKQESIVTKTDLSAEIGDLTLTGSVIVDDGKLVEESGITLSAHGSIIHLPLKDAKAMLAEMTSIVDELSGIVQRTTVVKEHERPGYTVAEHIRKIPLHDKDMVGNGAGLAHCAAEPPDDELTKRGDPRKRNRNFTAAEVRDVRALSKEGFTAVEIATAYKCKGAYVIRRILKGESYSGVAAK